MKRILGLFKSSETPATVTPVSAAGQRTNSVGEHYLKQLKVKIAPKYSVFDVWNFRHIQPAAPKKMLFSFREPKDIGHFKVITDSIIEGKSTATFEYDTELPLNLTVKDDILLSKKKCIKKTPKK